MNRAWARERLERFKAEAERWQNLSLTPNTEMADQSLMNLRKQEDTVRAILGQLLAFDDFNLDAAYGSGVGEARNLAQRGLGILDDLDEVAENLGPQGPSVAADQLHPWVWDAARGLWESGHYRQSVAAAAGLVSANLQTKVQRRDVNDDDLMTQSFSLADPQPGKPRLRLRGHDETARSRQEGALSYARGCYALIRNPAVHEVVEWPEALALERLAALSVLATLIDDCEVISIEDGQ